MQPGGTALIYWDPVTNIYFTTEPSKYGGARSLQPQEELFVTLVWLCCWLPIENFSAIFNIVTSTISWIIITWITFFHSNLRPLPIWNQRKTIDEFMPKAFKELYPSTRCIVDCTEIFIEMPTSYRCQSATFSNYKHHNTAKGLIEIAPSRSVTFVSELYTGRCSDEKITNGCGILNHLEPGDSIMTYRGFDIEDGLLTSVKLNIPPFLWKNAQLELKDKLKTRCIASVRIHVERAMVLIKTIVNFSQHFSWLWHPNWIKFG